MGWSAPRGSGWGRRPSPLFVGSMLESLWCALCSAHSTTQEFLCHSQFDALKEQKEKLTLEKLRTSAFWKVLLTNQEEENKLKRQYGHLLMENCSALALPVNKNKDYSTNERGSIVMKTPILLQSALKGHGGEDDFCISHYSNSHNSCTAFLLA